MNYFDKISNQTQTRLWINNPNFQEMELAISTGVKNVTTNPAYCSKLIKNEAEYIREVIDSIIIREKDDDIAADLVYQKATERIMKRFLGIYKDSKGSDGFVTIQLDPRQDENTDAIVEAAERHCRVGENYMAKIPVTSAGVKAIEIVLKKGIPVCATEVMSIAQALYICELHERVCKDAGKNVPMYVTHITGIFDEYLSRLAKLNKIQISPDILSQAGVAIGRKQYYLIKNRGYNVRMLGGGARGIQHFTEFAGGDMDITVNWSTVKELIDKDEEPINKINTVTSREVVSELCSKFVDFRKAYEDDGLKLEEFAHYGPVKLFKNNFIEGYYILLTEIAARRAQLLV